MKYYLKDGIPVPHRVPAMTRRQMLLNGGAGFGGLALAYLLGQPSAEARLLGTHHQATAKSVIFLFMEGGPSHIDLFDPKPKLNELAGQPLPESFGPVITPMGEYDAPLMASQREWKRHGESGAWASNWIPHIATCVDDIAIIRSCWGNGLNHSNGVCQMNTGAIIGGRPSLGAWVNYGLGTENEDLPAFIVMEDTPGKVINGPRNWSGGFMPAAYQGIPLKTDGEPIRNLQNPAGVTADRQRGKLALLSRLNRRHAQQLSSQSELEARIKSYELAFRMQAEAPEAVELTRESLQTEELYGLHEEPTERFGRMCLLARRLVERGVRFVQLYHGSGSRWDSHSRIEKNHSALCRQMDKPIAALLTDLKQRGLLDETLVVWGGEFGRSPMSEQGDGRDHNPYGFSMFMAGGGIKGGQTIGATDDIGLHAVEDRLHIHDLHASILHLLGIDNMQLTYLHQGSPERPTQNEGAFFRKLVS